MVVDNKGRVTYVRVLKEDLSIIRVSSLDGQPIPDFKAGQFVTLGSYIPNEKKVIRRAYSIASPPHQKKHFELLIRWVRKPLPGRLTSDLFSKKEGEEVIWVKPVGMFTINEKMHDGSPDNRRLILMGGGTGLAPFISYSLHLKQIQKKMKLLWILYHVVIVQL